jgi:serine protease inhibitor
MLRDPDGRVMFLPTWWKALMHYAAQVVNRHHTAIKTIDWAPVIEGTTREYKRYYAAKKFTLHEAFFPGDTITVYAVLPATLPIDDFKELLEVAGKYKGISPYRKDQYGTFDVVDVTRRSRLTPE